MAVRCISVSHEALGTVRVMRTCGMMGEVVGKAASICALNDCSPRDVYETHLDDLLQLIQLPGKARRSTPSAEIVIPVDALPLAGPLGPPTGQDPARIDGVVVDDSQATLEGSWTTGSGLKNYVSYGYRYASPNSGASATFTLKPPKPGRYEIQVYSQPHENRSTRTPVIIQYGDVRREYMIDQRTKTQDDRLVLETLELRAADELRVTIHTEKADGIVHIDAVRLLEVK
jgi:hypothetical protein